MKNSIEAKPLHSPPTAAFIAKTPRRNSRAQGVLLEGGDLCAFHDTVTSKSRRFQMQRAKKHLSDMTASKAEVKDYGSHGIGYSFGGSLIGSGMLKIAGPD